MNHAHHIKAVARDTSLGPVVFADYYRFGAGQESVPLIVYVGGATSCQEYTSRLTTEPEPIVREFCRTIADQPEKSADLLVLPFPPEADRPIHQELFSILLLELLIQTPNPRPQRIGCVGFSVGASFATYLTLGLIQVKALATLGGYGMTEAASMSRMIGSVPERKYRSWWNADSTGYMENLYLLHFLTNHEADMEIVTGQGGHDFTDYVKNGSVHDAFSYVLTGVLDAK